jgi:hypothetical protein
MSFKIFSCTVIYQFSWVEARGHATTPCFVMCCLVILYSELWKMSSQARAEQDLWRFDLYVHDIFPREGARQTWSS